MGDWYESMSRTPVRDECSPSRSRISVAPARPVIPATHLVIPAIESMPRTPIRGGNLGEVWVAAMTLELSHQTNAPDSHTFVRRRQPAWAIPANEGRSSRN